MTDPAASTRLLSALRRTGAVLDERGHPWALVGGLGIEPETCRDADQLEIAPGLVVPVAQAAHLVAMKVLAVAPDRPQDGVDLAALVPRLTAEERTRAVEAVAQIERLRANRGRALRSDLDAWLARYPPPG